ncbi:MAG: WG repeat-containing protein [Paludibacteraceae bacterium]|nr:WG repeat-containing protein [Paludibacteraceae bacterium]
MKREIATLLVGLFATQASFAGDDIADVIKQLRKDKVEAALKTRNKVKVTTSPDQFLYQLSECLAYNSKKNQQYNPLKAYDFYKKIAYSDYVTSKRVMDIFREMQFDMETVRLEVEKNLIDYANQSGKIETFDAIINACENCSYLDDAKNAKESMVLNKTLKGASLVEVEKFIAEYPNSSQIQKAIDLRDSIAFTQLPKTADAYTAYVERYPNSKYVPKIKEGLQKMSYDEAKTRDDINSYAKYIANYPEDSKAVSEFEKKIEDLQKYQTWKIEAKYKSIRMAEDTVKNKKYYLVNDFGQWGVKSFEGNDLIPASFEDMSDVNDGKLIAKKAGKWGVVDVESGSQILDFVANSASDIMFVSPDFIAFKQGGSWGLSYRGEKTAIQPFVSGSLSASKCKLLSNGSVAMQDAGRLVICSPDGVVKHDSQYDQVIWRTGNDIDSKFVKVRNGKKYGVFGQEGELMGQINHDMLPFFDADGVAIIKTSPTTEGWIDTTGTFLYHGPLQEYKACATEEKMVGYKVNGFWGFLDKTSSHANIDRQYLEIGECFENGIARVKLKDGRHAYINRKTEVICSVPETQASKMKRVGSVVFLRNGKNCEVYDKNGKVADITGYDFIDSEVVNGMLIVKKGGKVGALQGVKETVPVQYDDMTRFCNGYSIVTLNGKKGLLYYNNVILEPKYDRLLDPSHYVDSDCELLTSGKEADVIFVNTFEGQSSVKFVIKAGKIILQTPDEIRLRKFNNMYTAVETADMGLFNQAKTALVSKDGKLVVAPTYRQITALDENYFACKTADGRLGVLDLNGNEVVVPFAQNISSFNGKVVVAETNGDNMCYDKAGVSFLPKGSDLNGNIFKNKKNNMYGVVDDNGDIKLHTMYKKVASVDGNSAIVLVNDKYGVIKF